VTPGALIAHTPGGFPKNFAGTGARAWLVRVKRAQVFAVALLGVLAAGCVHAPPAAAARSDPALERVMSLGDLDHALLCTAVYNETNRVRAAHGSPPLGHLDALDAAADLQATYLALTLTVGHTNPFPGLRDVDGRVIHEGLGPGSAGENVIMMPATRPPDAPDREYTYAAYAAFLLEGWMNSPDHRQTLLDPRFTQFGSSARLAHGFKEGDQRIFAVQVFYVPVHTHDPDRDPANIAPRPAGRT
jgi:uncharacterized protein YkwD